MKLWWRTEKKVAERHAQCTFNNILLIEKRREREKKVCTPCNSAYIPLGKRLSELRISVFFLVCTSVCPFRSNSKNTRNSSSRISTRDREQRKNAPEKFIWNSRCFFHYFVRVFFSQLLLSLLLELGKAEKTKQANKSRLWNRIFFDIYWIPN